MFPSTRREVAASGCRSNDNRNLCEGGNEGIFEPARTGSSRAAVSAYESGIVDELLQGRQHFVFSWLLKLDIIRSVNAAISEIRWGISSQKEVTRLLVDWTDGNEVA